MSAYNMNSLFEEVQRRREPWEMNFYGLMRKLASGGNWTEEERQGALTLVDELEKVGAFGSTTATIKETGGN